MAAPQTRGEPNLDSSEGDVSTTIPHSPSDGLDDGGPTRRRRLAGHRHHHGSRKLPLPGTAMPLAVMDPARQARPNLEGPRTSLKLTSADAGAPPPSGARPPTSVVIELPSAAIPPLHAARSSRNCMPPPAGEPPPGERGPAAAIPARALPDEASRLVAGEGGCWGRVATGGI